MGIGCMRTVPCFFRKTKRSAGCMNASGQIAIVMISDDGFRQLFFIYQDIRNLILFSWNCNLQIFNLFKIY